MVRLFCDGLWLVDLNSNTVDTPDVLVPSLLWLNRCTINFFISSIFSAEFSSVKAFRGVSPSDYRTMNINPHRGECCYMVLTCVFLIIMMLNIFLSKCLLASICLLRRSADSLLYFLIKLFFLLVNGGGSYIQMQISTLIFLILFLDNALYCTNIFMLMIY